ncbi:MAG: class I SAM-dependent methyltransferase [Thermodesulfobacteriota bacterium]|nr:MAG: class I SAM-dependent methyltransferase [Thermodesulfobacteriota bacterium]
MKKLILDYKTENICCYLCGSTESDYFLTAEDDLTGMPGRFIFVRCRSCGLIYQNPRLSIDEVKRFYTDDYIAHRKNEKLGPLSPLYSWAMGKHDRDKIKLIEPYVRLNSDSCVLDVGCSVGTFLLLLKKTYHCSIVGVDFKDTTYYPGFNEIDFHLGLFYEQKLPAYSYDLITMWHFLEHDYRPRESLQKAQECLKDKGILIIEVPRLDSLTYKLYGSRWPGVQSPQHTVLYSKKHLLEIVKKEGFDLVDYLAYGAFPAYFYLFAGAAFKMLKGKGLTLKKAILPYFTGQLFLAPFLLFEKYLNLSMQTVILKKV